MTFPRRTILAFVLAMVLVTPWASAEPRMDIGSRDAFTRLWSLLTSLWSEAGCQLDPDGKCAPNLPDAGCEADPNGRCLPEQDPSPTNDLDAGCQADPDGRPSCVS